MLIIALNYIWIGLALLYLNRKQCTVGRYADFNITDWLLVLLWPLIAAFLLVFLIAALPSMVLHNDGKI